MAKRGYARKKIPASTIGKALYLLRVMLETHEDVGVRALARASELPVTTVHRFLLELNRAGMIQISPQSGNYMVGLEFYRLLWEAEARYPVRDVALRFMREIAAECNETILLGLYSHTRMEMMFAAVADPAHQLRYIVPLNEWVPVHAGASGLAILAFLPSEEIEKILEETKLYPVTQQTITSRKALAEELQRTRARGYASTRGQRIPGAVGLAAPIWINGQVIGDLVLTVPEQRFDPSKEQKLAELLIRNCLIIGDQMNSQTLTKEQNPRRLKSPHPSS